ncbi:glycoside hydrolase [Streptomyces spiroverticillatus]|uniref:Glycoside hydrolase n=1 Tax=Streptomyces finlayi TaxID=67296 RepID=A0A918WTF2_9ACTN|nr:C40 family peptidase [Streptomyces finlayi]GGZ89546.1 glycoside hydrolase [Streptomyces spiroverticillatus]GHC80407.1 glycoside hydrolase [Streptomyces finlayi]
MSHTAHIPSHRKPRRSASKMALRAGVAGGVLSTIAVAGAAAPANADPVHETTVEMPTLTDAAAAKPASTVSTAAEATQQIAFEYDRQARQEAAAETAMKDAKKAKAEADRKAEAEKKAAEAREKAEKKAAEERASRSSDRSDLSSYSSSSASSSKSTATGSAAAVIAFARAQVGDAYVLGSTGPNAWDCSGLTQAAFRTIGVDLPRVSQSQSTFGKQVGLNNLQPGDILYWGGAGSAYHVGIYVGGGNFVGAQNSGTGVVERPLSYDPPTGAVRVL